MKKIKFVALLLITSVLLCGCSFLNNMVNPGAQTTPTPTTTTPAVTTTTGDAPTTTGGSITPTQTTTTTVVESELKLKLELTGEETVETQSNITYYRIDLYQNTSYKINISIDGYEGNDYYISHSVNNGQDKINVASDLTVTPKSVTSTSSSFMQFDLKKASNNRTLNSLYIMFIVNTYEKHDVSLSFEEDNLLFNKRSEYLKWFFNIRPGVDFEIKPIVTGIEDYEIRYENSHTSHITITNNVVSVVGNPTSQIYFNFYLQIYDKTGHKHLSQSIGCYINGDKEGDNPLYKDVFIDLEDPESRVVVGEDDVYDFSITVPYEHVEYELPHVRLAGYEGDFRYEFLNASSYEDFLSLDKHDDLDYFAGHSEYAKVRVNVYNDKEELMDHVVCRVKYTNTGKGEFTLQNKNSKDVIKQDIEADIFEDEVLNFVPYFNNHDNLINDAAFSYNVSNDAAAKIEVENNALTLTTLKAGNVLVTFSYSKEDANHTNYNYECKFNLTVKRRNLLEIFANNPSTIAVSGDVAVINGKMLARYSGDRIIPINSMPGLSYVVANTSDTNIKKVTFTYNDGYTSKQIYYNVDVRNNLYQKQSLTGNYYEYHDNKRCEAEGNARILAIPVWFTNSSEFISDSLKDANNKTQKEQILEDLETVLFGEYSDKSYYSLAQYYNIESRDTLTITGTVSEWFEYSKSSKAVNRSIESSKEVADAAVSWYFTTHTDESWEEYDLNDDGYIDGLIIYYGAPYLGNPSTDAEANASARAFFTNSMNKTLKFYGYCYISAFDPYDIKGIDSKTAITAHPDLSSNKAKISSETSIHEFGHALGLTDLYDTELDGENYPAGRFTMQDYDDGSHDPYSTLAFGWNSVYIFDSSDTTLANSITFTINDFQSSGDLILLTPHMNDTNSVFDEYILIELYTPTVLNADVAEKMAGYRINLPVSIKVWHINATLASHGSHLYSNSAEDGAKDNTAPNLVHLIRNDVESKYGLGSEMFKEETAFLAGDEFSVAKYNTQFVGDGVLDSGLDLGWTFTIDSINSYSDGTASATITLTKTA